jgi:hypothetical protein
MNKTKEQMPEAGELQTNERDVALSRSPTVRRLLRAYGPVLLIVVAFILIALLVPTLDLPAA